MKISLWGTGLLGKPILLRLANFYNIYACNRTLDKLKDISNSNINIISFEESIKLSNTILLVLTDYKAIEKTLLNHKRLLFGKDIIQMGTILPDESKFLEKEILNNNGNYVEAPVLGSGREAEIGKLNIIFSGKKNMLEKYNELLSYLGNINYISEEIGKASTLKLALNQLIASLTTSFSYSLSLILKEEINPELFMNILRNSSLYAPTFDKKLSKMISNDFSTANFTLKHLLKDIQLVKKHGDILGLNNNFINSIEEILDKGVKLDYLNEDYSAIFKVIKNEI